GLTIDGLGDGVAGRAKDLDHRGADGLLVVHDEHIGEQGAVHVVAGSFTGRITVARTPPVAAFSSEISPPWAWTSRCTMASPNPVPLSFVVKKGSKIRCMAASWIPF